MTHSTADPRWRRRSRWIAIVALVFLATSLATIALWQASRPAGLAILVSGVGWLSYAAIVLRDIGGVGSDDGVRWIEYYKKSLGRLPFYRHRDPPPGFANTYRRWEGIVSALIGAGYVLMGALLLAGAIGGHGQ